MPLANPYRQYQNTSVQTADKAQLLLLTYEAIVRWLNRADAAITESRVMDAHDALIAAQTLVGDLANSLDFRRGGDVAINLARLYDYMVERLVSANVSKDNAIVEEVHGLVSSLLDAWRIAVVHARRDGLVAAH
ncbi:MAG: flagellar export chaperone FliS [Chloroflexota bacterium]|nr:flagellar export chaperone FliS [Chloroflexota bacterium]